MSAPSFKSIIGVSPSTATAADSTLLIIDAQQEYQDGQLKTANIDSTRPAIASLLEKYRTTSHLSLIHI